MFRAVQIGTDHLVRFGVRSWSIENGSSSVGRQSGTRKKEKMIDQSKVNSRFSSSCKSMAGTSTESLSTSGYMTQQSVARVIREQAVKSLKVRSTWLDWVHYGVALVGMVGM